MLTLDLFPLKWIRIQGPSYANMDLDPDPEFKLGSGSRVKVVKNIDLEPDPAFKLGAGSSVQVVKT